MQGVEHQLEVPVSPVFDYTARAGVLYRRICSLQVLLSFLLKPANSRQSAKEK